MHMSWGYFKITENPAFSIRAAWELSKAIPAVLPPPRSDPDMTPDPYARQMALCRTATATLGALVATLALGFMAAYLLGLV